MKKDKEEWLKIKTIEDFYLFDVAVCERLWNDYYNNYKKNQERKKRIQELFHISKKLYI